ncbi:methyl-accepting chemotaxis protein [Vibrio mangrovi]|uniref:Methyl-accepting chemotaxis protein n=1 Tax=Vibrio mangrovi TaxID=474394 RepID=A0A1Y6IRT4_9VIBR|nr:methyl-accepting chemotaxis protein [Vibrio mangrovi]MDW6003698.1 methyl-accepting chemotaxis protein [Vibrio mangrovi]SMR99510.1 Methyl-accepting chemotaxis protein CtpH [Vibrio mangrovi]
MDVLKLSQKQKITIFIIVLCLGFLSMGLFIAQKLSTMTSQYEQSGDISQGTTTLFASQAKLLSLAAERGNIRIKDVPRVTELLTSLATDIDKDVSFLKGVDFASESESLLEAISRFESAMRPWLTIKTELGFSVSEGKQGELARLAEQIEAKIEETGMVTIRSDFRAMIKSQQNYLLSPNEKNLKLFNRAMAMFINTSKLYAALASYQSEVDQFKQTFARVGELSQQAKNYEMELAASEQAAQELIHNVSDKLKSVSRDYQQTAHREATQTLWSVMAACAALAVITITIFVTLRLSLTRSLTQTKTFLDALSQGDLSRRLHLTANQQDEFNQLAVALNESCEHLGLLVNQVQKNSQALSGDAADLNHGLDQLVFAQTEIIRQTDLLASATEEVSVTTQEVSNSLEFVADVSKASTSAAQEGGEIIEAAIQSLQDVGNILSSAAGHIQQLEAASEKVDSVMEIINGIAEQTNLLALNAAIEAARAGEQGRGFAVVADEVRNLAVKTVDAVTEITDTIETMKRESAEVIQYIGQSEDSMKRGQEQGQEAIQALSHITEKASEAASQTEVIFESIKELAVTSHSMADSMVQISSSMKNLEENNERLRETSKVVDRRSTSLSEDCQRFTV